MLQHFLIDVPVRINIWIRPECQKRQFDIIKKARPSILFLSSDGGRTVQEWDKIKQNRQMIEEGIDWDCTVYRLYENENLGLYAKAKKTSTFIWEHVDRCIFLEDDQIPSISFFQYCAELLERYKDDLRIECICGMNHLGVSKNVTADYFFSRQGSIWGIATWKRSHMERDSNFSYGKDPYVMKLLKERTQHNKIFRQRYEAYAKQKYYEGHVAGGEFWIEFSMYAHNRLQIIPKVNMISNIGATENSAHADNIKLLPRGLRKVFNMQTYEMSFPMKHAEYVIPDIEYEKKRNRIMAYNVNIFIRGWRAVERIFLKMKAGDILYLFKAIKKKLKRNTKLEK